MQYISKTRPNKKKTEIKKEISYIKKLKIAAICYIIITWVINKNRTTKFISKYCTCLDQNIIQTMFFDQIKCKNVMKIIY